MSAEAFQSAIGNISDPVKNEVEKGAIRKFADAIGDDNPLYRDEDFARTTRYGKIIAPPTFSRTFDYGRIPDFELPFEGLIHGSQEFEYIEPIYAGDVLYCTNKLVDVFDKSGKLGSMTFLVFEQVASRESGRPVVKQRSTVIYRGQ